MTIKKLLKDKPFCNELHFFLLIIVLICLSIKYTIFSIFVIIYLIFIYKKTKLFIPIFTTSLIFLGSYYTQNNIIKDLGNTLYEGEFIVDEIKDNYMIIKGEENIIIFTKNVNLVPGDVILCKIQLRSLETKSYDGDFDSKEYYKSKRINHKGDLIDYKIVDHKLTFNYLRYTCIKFYECKLRSKTFNYLKAIYFGESDFEKEVDIAYKTLYISHILTISGMHIIFLYEIFKKFFNKIFKIEGSIIAIFILFLYILFLDFKISALRAFLFLFIGLINKIGYIKYTKLDIFSITFILMIVINPFLMNQTGFILSYMVSFVMLFMNEITNGYEKHKVFLNTLICVLMTLPIIININNEVAILGLVYACIISIFLPKVLLYLMLLVLILPSNFYEFIFIGLDYILVFLSNNSLTIKFPHISIYLALLYYVLFVLLVISLIKKRRILHKIILICIYMICIKSLVYLNPNYKVTFIDVGQGDSALIQAPNNKCNILIDCYNNLDYLSSLGVNNIDYIFLSHLDNDHIGSLKDVISQYNTKNIYFSYYSDDSKVDFIDNKWIRLKGEDEIKINDIKIQVLSPTKYYPTENENSLVLKVFLYQFSFLFTGDISKNVEKDLLEIYGNGLKSDVLKVAHHGSNTSSSKEFINMVKPKYSIISVLENNYYGLPDIEVVEYINNFSNLYLTKNCGNITFIISYKKIKINIYKR